MPARKIDKPEEMKLEEAMKRLDEVVSELGSDNGDLDASLKLYEEGVRLVRICNEKLGDAERRVKVLRMSSDGEISEEIFDNGENK